MKYLIIDTETTGLFDFSKPADGEGQPRLAQICMIEWDGESAPTCSADRCEGRCRAIVGAYQHRLELDAHRQATATAEIRQRHTVASERY